MLHNLLTQNLFAQVWGLLRRLLSRAGRANLGLLSAGVAFFGMLGLFPALAAVLAVFGLVANPTEVLDQLALLRGVIPDDAYFLLEAQLHKLLFAGDASLTWATLLSFAVAFWSSRVAVAALIQGINAVHGVSNRHSARHILVALVLTGLLVLVAVVALSAVVVAPVVLRLVPLDLGTVRLLELTRWSVVLVTLLSGLSLLYRYGPNLAGQRPPWFSPGAVLVIVLWFAASAVLSSYFTNFGRFNEVYGSIGAVIAMQLWLYVTAYLVMLGAAFDAELRARPDEGVKSGMTPRG